MAMAMAMAMTMTMTMPYSGKTNKMDKNTSIVQAVQEKIDRIVEEAPKLFDRLDVVMASTAVFGLLCDQEPVLRLLRPLRVNMPCPLSAPILDGVVTNSAVENKREELKQLTEEVFMLFERIQDVLNWNAIKDICYARGRIVILPEGHNESLRIIDVDLNHLESLHEEQLREEILRELDSSPSSVDSYSR